MAKYHINHKGEVKPCQARVKCRYGGASGSDNHFSNIADAEQAVQKRFSEKYGATNAVSRKGKSASQEALASLSKKGVAVTTVSSVSSHRFQTPGRGSSVDVIDEKPTRKLLESITSGAVKAFN